MLDSKWLSSQGIERTPSLHTSDVYIPWLGDGPAGWSGGGEGGSIYGS